MNLITLVETKKYLDITTDTKDAALSLMIEKVSALIESYCKRAFGKTEYKELYSGSGDYELMLDNYPIISVEKLSQDTDKDNQTYGTLITDAEQLLHKKEGVIELFNATFTKGNRNVYIEYTAGYENIPQDLKLICMNLLAKKWYDVDEKRIGVTTKNIMGENISFNYKDLTEGDRKALALFRKKDQGLNGVAVIGWTAES